MFLGGNPPLAAADSTENLCASWCLLPSCLRFPCVWCIKSHRAVWDGSQLGPLLNRFICYKAMQKDGKEEHGGKKIDSRLCIDHLMYSRDKRGYQRGWFWGNEETRGLNTSGLSVQGSASIVAPILLKNSSAQFTSALNQQVPRSCFHRIIWAQHQRKGLVPLPVFVGHDLHLKHDVGHT
ncbi:uncharacterized protein LOC111943851 isoform X2 [Cyanistes caeruleus]|uniref:uncharacterized protein LOC111943851 isoform X2 n=1 Tax=Cyanistes caeruleus TaxID=156563 RepID=UPI000CDAD2B4|nr:uncharacterized protein LOC111943851 isoform X2 [Cyanistes caeruleus]